MSLLSEWNVWKKLGEVNEENKKLTDERDMYKKRCHEIEDQVGENFKVKLRNEITEYKIDFDLAELSVIYSAICKQMENRMSTDEVQYYLNLRIKIEGLLDKVKE